MPSIQKQHATAKPSPTNGAKVSVVDRIKPIGFDKDEGLNILVYGGPGSGKTHFWGTFPKPILCITCSGGLMSGETRTLDTAANRKVIDQVGIENTEEIFELAGMVHKTGKYKTVVLDHCTGFQDQALKDFKHLDEVPVQKGWGVASQQEWGQIIMMCKQQIKALLALKQHTVIISHEKLWNSKDEVEQASDQIKPYLGAAQAKSLAGWLNTNCDYVCQTFKRQRYRVEETVIGQGKTAQTLRQEIPEKGVDYCLRVGPSVEVITKFRMPDERNEGGQALAMPEVIVDPSYQKVRDLLDGKISRTGP